MEAKENGDGTLTGEPDSVLVIEGVEVDLCTELNGEDGDGLTVGQQMHLVGALLAKATREQMRAEAHYRAWRGRTTVQVSESKPKWSEWKVKAHVDSGDEFALYKEGLARAAHNVIYLQALVDSFKV